MQKPAGRGDRAAHTASVEPLRKLAEDAPLQGFAARSLTAILTLSHAVPIVHSRSSERGREALTSWKHKRDKIAPSASREECQLAQGGCAVIPLTGSHACPASSSASERLQCSAVHTVQTHPLRTDLMWAA